MSTEGVKRRSYDNTRRAEQARSTRRRVRDAARDLLLERGYGGTAMSDVAAAAGVSVETVYKAFGNKGALVKAVYDVTLAGDDEPVPVRDRPGFRAIAAEPDPRRKLALYAGLGGAMWGRVGPLLAVLMAGAQAGDPELVEFVATIRRESHAGATGMARHLAEAGALRPDLPVERAADEVWLLIQPEIHRLLTVERGWPLDEVERWLARALADALLP